MLVYLTKFCFYDGNRCQASNDPFKLTYISTIEQIYEKVKVDDFSEYFDELDNVFYYEYDEEEYGDLQQQL